MSKPEPQVWKRYVSRVGLSLLRWQSDRPERRVFLLTITALVVVCALLAIVPKAYAERLLDLILPSSSRAGSTARPALLQYHGLVFGVLAISLAAVAFLAPTLSRMLDRFVHALAGLNRRAFFALLLGLVVSSRLFLVGEMRPIVPGQDTGHYYQLANTLLDEGRYIEYASHPREPDGYRAWRLPGYPFALSAALLLTGRQPWAVVALNTLWMVVLVLSVYGLVRALASEREARLASLACALYPTLVTASLRAMSELQFASLLVLAAYVLVARPADLRWTLLGGSVLGLAALTRGNGLLILLVLLVTYPAYLWMRRRQAGAAPWNLRRLALGGAVLALGFGVTITPWMMRNRLVLGHWVPLATSGGANMWIGHHPGGSGLHRANTQHFPPGAGEVEKAQYGSRQALRYWLEDPLANLRIGGRIVIEILKIDEGMMPLLSSEREDSGEKNPPARMQLIFFAFFNLLYYALWGLIGVWAVARLLRAWPRDYSPAVPVFLALLYISTYIPFIGWGRYKIPAIPLLIAAATIVAVTLSAAKLSPTGEPGEDRKRDRDGLGNLTSGGLRSAHHPARR